MSELNTLLTDLWVAAAQMGGAHNRDEHGKAMRQADAKRDEIKAHVAEKDRRIAELEALCRQMRIFLDHPEQKSWKAWELIKRANEILEESE